jgi:hypothetical protein
MTAIAGIVEDGKVWIGGDSAGVGGLSMTTRSDPKVFVNGEFVFGYTSSFRMGQLLEHEFSPPTPYEGQNGMAYMVKRFIPGIRELMKTGGYQINHNGQEQGGTFLVGYRGHLYAVQDDYQVCRVLQPYHACGCGRDIVLGSLYTTSDLDMGPEERIRKALDAASEFSAGVRGPYAVLCM